MFYPGCNEESLKTSGYGSDKIKFTFMKEHSGYREKSRPEASQPSEAATGVQVRNDEGLDQENRLEGSG